MQHLGADAGFAAELMGVGGSAAVDAVVAEGQSVVGETAAMGHAAV